MEPLQQPYNLFKTPQLTNPMQVYDPTKTVQENMEGKGTPSAQNIVSAFSPQQPVVQEQKQTTPVQGVQQPIRSMDDLVNAMYTDPREEEKLRKASVANQRIVAVADALRQIGNIYNTTRYAPSQQFNSPVEMERQRYLQGKALRDKANQTYISYQQAKAAQDAKQRQWEATFNYNAAKDARDYALKKNESDARANLNEAKINRYETLMALDQAKKEGIISDNEWKAQRAKLYPELTQSQIARNNRTGTGKSGGGSRGRGGSSMPDYDVDTVYERDEEGRVTKSTKTRRVKHTDGKTSSSTKTNVGNFSIRGKKEEQKKTNVGNFSIHK